MFPFKQNKFVFQTETSSMSDKQSVYVFDKNLKKNCIHLNINKENDPKKAQRKDVSETKFK